MFIFHFAVQHTLWPTHCLLYCNVTFYAYFLNLLALVSLINHHKDSFSVSHLTPHIYLSVSIIHFNFFRDLKYRIVGIVFEKICFYHFHYMWIYLCITTIVAWDVKGLTRSLFLPSCKSEGSAVQVMVRVGAMTFKSTFWVWFYFS